MENLYKENKFESNQVHLKINNYFNMAEKTICLAQYLESLDQNLS